MRDLRDQVAHRSSTKSEGQGAEATANSPAPEVSCGGTCAGRHGIGESPLGLPTAHTGAETQAAHSAGIEYKTSAEIVEKVLNEASAENK